ncbi:DUF6702 family protein [Massilia sp. GCM10020059]|uniref:Uncharacterized protein n=1 Tax=Massilia agrisoli TaxID=2892444 RepID=A0ABS8ITE5_9BURK|nr:DUF6702 family protein [Massilia agrisoli]MCC6071103.1 hypothetical protein [Massilia agrisoli]
MRRLKFLAAAALVCISAAAHAHRYHAGITDMSFNARTGSTEIVHTYMLHDVEALLANLYQRRFDLQDPDDEAVLRKYIEQRFYLLAPDKSRLPLRWVGVAVDTQSVIIYQELDATPLEKIATIHDDVLIDFLPDQVNTINLGPGAAVRSLTFQRDSVRQHP